jgi:hypothetical protein
MGTRSRVRTLRRSGTSRPMIAGLILVFGVLLSTQASLAQQAQSAPQPYEEMDDWYLKKVNAALDEKCRTQKVQDAIKSIKENLPSDDWAVVEFKRQAELDQEILTDKERDGESVDGIKAVLKDALSNASKYTNRAIRERYDLSKLEAKPPCAEPKGTRATQPPPPKPPAEFGALPLCGDVSAEIKRLTEELTKLSKERTGLEATLAKDTREYNAAAALYPEKNIGNGSTYFPEVDPRVISARTAMEADQRRLADTRTKIESDKKRIAALYGVPPCTETPQASAPPAPTPPGPPLGANPPCRTKDDDSEYVRLDAELERLSQEREKLIPAAASPAGKTALSENNKKIEDVMRKKDAIRAREPCPPEPKSVEVPPCLTGDDKSEYLRLDAELQRLSQERDNLIPAATNPAGKAALSENNKKIEDVMRKKDAIRARESCPPQPAAGQVPPENEHGMAPNQPSGPGLPFGFGFGGGSGFGFGGGSDEGQSDRGFGKNQNRKP